MHTDSVIALDDFWRPIAIQRPLFEVPVGVSFDVWLTAHREDGRGERDSWGHLGMLAVRHPLRTRGIGRLLMETALARADGHDTLLTLLPGPLNGEGFPPRASDDTTEADRLRLRSYYERFGFTHDPTTGLMWRLGDGHPRPEERST